MLPIALDVRVPFQPVGAGLLALILVASAYMAEVIRAGIQAVPKGQSEAAYAIGMRKGQVTRIILLPQAVKIMLPAIISQMVVALKDTSLGYAVAAPGLTEIGERSLVGTALAFQMGIGFALTVVCIQLTPMFAHWVGGWQWAFLLLVPGPLIGATAMLKLRSLPESARIAQGLR